MKLIFPILFLSCLLSLPSKVIGQRSKAPAVQIGWDTSIQVDGNMDEWGDLPHSYVTQKFLFDVRNDQNNVYLAIEIEDRETQQQALMHGVTWTINPKGKKREDRSITFPLADRTSYRAIMAEDHSDKPKDAREGALRAVRGIYLMKFDDIVDGLVSLNNTYGVSAKASVGENGKLYIEMALPIKRLGLAKSKDALLAMNIKINGVPAMVASAPSRPAPMMNTRGYGSYPVSRTRLRVEPGIWFISTLAIQKNNS